MSNLYVTEATVKARLGSRATSLLDRDGDDVSDEGLLASIIESKGRWINMRLRQRYGTNATFAEITDNPATPEGIQEIALNLVLWEVYSWAEPNGRDADMHRALADTALTALLEGEFDLDGVARAEAHEGRRIVVYTAEDPVFSGTDSAGGERLRGV